MFSYVYQHRQVGMMYPIFTLPDLVSAYCQEGIQTGKVPDRLRDPDFFKDAYENEAIYAYCEVFLKVLWSFTGPFDFWEFKTGEPKGFMERFPVGSERLAGKLLKVMEEHYRPSGMIPYGEYLGYYVDLYEYSQIDLPILDRYASLFHKPYEWAENIKKLEEGTTANFDEAWLSFWIELLCYYLQDFSDWKHAGMVGKLTRSSAESILEGTWTSLPYVWKTCLKVCEKPEQRQVLAELMYSAFPHKKTLDYLSRRLGTETYITPVGGLSLAENDSKGGMSISSEKGALSTLK